MNDSVEALFRLAQYVAHEKRFDGEEADTQDALDRANLLIGGMAPSERRELVAGARQLAAWLSQGEAS